MQDNHIFSVPDVTVLPTVHEMTYQDPFDIFAKVADQNAVVFLDSAAVMPASGRYSFIALDPFMIVTSKNGQVKIGQEILSANPFDVLKEQLQKFPLIFHDHLPPFQGGICGYFSYDLCHHLENIPRAKTDDLQFPDLAVGLYDVVMAFDVLCKRAWIFSSGYPHQDQVLRKQYAKARIEWLLQQLSAESTALMVKPSLPVEIRSNFSALQYQAAVQKVKNHILAGDIFQANISQRFQAMLAKDDFPFALYQRLRAINPAPFSAYVQFDEVVLASASPERFLQLKNKQVETRPIKGTLPRGTTPDEDAKLADALLQSAKDRAENVMIVDLLRNDLSRVCEAHSVKVLALCHLESYAHVHHLVSVIIGQLRAEYTAIDLLLATFPGGSVTGAPKIRAMEIIADLEPTSRGPYCGSIGYLGFNGDMDCSIVIRTFAIKNNQVTFQAGGAVVLDSHPIDEYEETLTKVRALQRVLS